MQKLKHLFNNQNLAYMLLENYNHDLSDESQLNRYRISSNAVYPYKNSEETNFLRFSPTTEKHENYLAGELDFMQYLISNNYPAVKINKTINDAYYVKQKTPWGEYLVSSFKIATGSSLDNIALDYEIIQSFGVALGKLHQLSKKSPKFSRPSCEDIFDTIYDYLVKYKGPKLAFDELRLLKNYFLTLEKSKNNYGLIHYDFELDNTYYEAESKTFNVFDFDDSMYNFYIIDIHQSLDSVYDYLGDLDKQKAMDFFITGYQQETDFDIEDLKLMSVCKRFSNLYSYARILRSSYESWENEPSWLILLREKLQNAMVSRASQFNNPI